MSHCLWIGRTCPWDCQDRHQDPRIWDQDDCLEAPEPPEYDPRFVDQPWDDEVNLVTPLEDDE